MKPSQTNIPYSELARQTGIHQRSIQKIESGTACAETVEEWNRACPNIIYPPTADQINAYLTELKRSGMTWDKVCRTAQISEPTLFKLRRGEASKSVLAHFLRLMYGSEP
jgi:hypothetical protein